MLKTNKLCPLTFFQVRNRENPDIKQPVIAVYTHSAQTHIRHINLNLKRYKIHIIYYIYTRKYNKTLRLNKANQRVGLFGTDIVPVLPERKIICNFKRTQILFDKCTRPEHQLILYIMKKLRIFISSPGDVRQERMIAKKVISDLDRVYQDYVRLEAILWEDLPLEATGSFQA